MIIKNSILFIFIFIQLIDINGQLNQIVYTPELKKSWDGNYYVFGKTLKQEFLMVKLDYQFNEIVSVKLPFEKTNGLISNVIILKNQLIINFENAKLRNKFSVDNEFNVKVVLSLDLDTIEYYYQTIEERSQMCKEIIKKSKGNDFFIFDFQLDYFNHFYNSDYLYVLVDNYRPELSKMDTIKDNFEEMIEYTSRSNLFLVKYSYEINYINGFPTFLFSQIGKINLGKKDHRRSFCGEFIDAKEVLLATENNNKFQLLNLNLSHFRIINKSKYLGFSNSFLLNLEINEIKGKNLYFITSQYNNGEYANYIIDSNFKIISTFKLNKKNTVINSIFRKNIIEISGNLYTTILARNKSTKELEIYEIKVINEEIIISIKSFDSIINCFPKYKPDYIIDWFVHDNQFIYLAHDKNELKKDYCPNFEELNNCVLNDHKTSKLFKEWCFGAYFLSESGNEMLWFTFEKETETNLNMFNLKVTKK